MRMTFLPSGENLKPSMSMSLFVSCRRSVPSGAIDQSCPSVRKAMRLPPSIHAGSVSLFADVVSTVCCLPSAVCV